MALIDLTLPTAGLPNSTEDPKVVTALSTIEAAINGDLDDTNIAASADINGNKLLADSVDTTQLADDAVEAAQLAALAVLSGNINFAFHSNTGTEVVAGTTGLVLASCASVAPGTYLVVGQCSTNNTAHTLAIDTDGTGAATITQPTSQYTSSYQIAGQGGTLHASGIQIARAVVTSTTTLRLTATRAGVSTLLGSLYVFGVTAA